MHLTPDQCTGTWHIAVHSWSGSGWFNLTKSRHKSSSPEHKPILRVGIAFDADNEITGGVNAVKDWVEQNMRQTYGAWEGQRFVSAVYLYNNTVSDTPGEHGNETCGSCGGNQCDVCYEMSDPSWGAYCCDPLGRIIIRPMHYFDWEIITHEMGHEWGLGDEYGSGFSRNCGHSIMDNHQGSNNNFCKDFDHNTDGNGGAAATSAWDVLGGDTHIVFTPAGTPDNYDYRDFGFDGLMGSVTVQ